MSVKDWRFWASLLVGVFAFSMLGQLAARHAAESVSGRQEPPASLSSGTKDMVVVVTRQSALGVTQDVFTADLLEGFREWAVERTLANVDKARQEQGLSGPAPAVEADAGYVEIGQRKLAVIRTRMKPIRGVTVIGIVGSELVKVGCIQEHDSDVPITFGECGAKVSEVFGVTFRP